MAEEIERLSVECDTEVKRVARTSESEDGVSTTSCEAGGSVAVYWGKSITLAEGEMVQGDIAGTGDVDEVL